MSGNRKPKFNYKLFNTRTERYMSWNNKATWTNRSWVSSRLRGERIHEIEVHIFPVNEPIRQSAQSFLEEEASAELDRQSKKLEEDQKRKEKIKHQEHLEDIRKMNELQEKIKQYQSCIK
jgi:hypothetical protein